MADQGPLFGSATSDDEVVELFRAAVTTILAQQEDDPPSLALTLSPEGSTIFVMHALQTICQLLQWSSDHYRDEHGVEQSPLELWQLLLLRMEAEG